MDKKKLISYFLTTFFTFSIVNTPIAGVHADTISDSTATNITVDGSKANQNPANKFKGFGMVSANGTSRLLLDYKSENPDKYWKIMNELFNPKTGMGLNHFKVELGADLNTSTQTTPATMRSEDEKANVLRGTDWHIAADAKTINPNITIDALRWAEPKWINNAFAISTDAGYAARYKWYKNTIDAVYDTYGLKIDDIDPDRNETTSPETAWIKYFSKHLKNEADERYDYSKIKIVASDENGTLKLATLMKSDTDLLNAVDVLSMHYNAYGNADIRLMNQTYHKEIWYSEGTAPMTFAENRLNASTPAGGLGGANGILDTANHLINMYYSGDTTSAYMTRYEFQPAISSFYDGGQYSSKELIAAERPWSGYFYSDAGVQMVRHFMNFAQLGWEYIDGACFGDGVGANSITSTTNNYLTLTDPSTGDYSMIFTNDSAAVRNYSVTVKNLTKAGDVLKVWETKGPDVGQAYDANWMKHISDITPSQNADGSYTFTYSVKPYSIVTLTTTGGQSEYTRDAEQSPDKDTLLKLPYTDDFEYKDAKYASYKDTTVLNSNKQGYLTSRGDTPRYTTDIGGALEVNEGTNNNTLMAMIDESTHANGEWNKKPGNDTVLGDNRWANYQVSIDFLLDTTTAGQGPNYAGIAARDQVTSGGENPEYILKVFKDCTYQLLKGSTVLKSGTIDSFDNTKWHNESLKVLENTITAYVDGKELTEFTDTTSQYMSGRVGITSGYYHTQYDNLKVLPVEGYPAYISRVDDLDSSIQYQGMWSHIASTGYGNFNRTNSVSSMNLAVSYLTKTSTEGALNAFYYYKPSGTAWGSNSDNAWSQEAGSYYEFSFKGSGLTVYGYKNSNNGTGNVYLDGQLVSPNVSFKSSTAGRAVIYQVNNLDENSIHTLKVAVASGFVSAAGVEISSSQYAPGSITYNFTGTGFNLVGNTAASNINVTVDGEKVSIAKSVAKTGDRASSYFLSGLNYGNHTVLVQLASGSYSFDAIEVLGEAYTSLENITVESDKSYLKPGDMAKLTVSGVMHNGAQADLKEAQIVYESDNEQAAKVDENGTITATGEGIANIKAAVTLFGITKEGITQIIVDNTPPVTSAEVKGAIKNNWYNSDVAVILSGRDNLSGIDKTEYRIGDSGDWTPYNGPITISKEGINLLQYRSIDKAGNNEELKQQTISIDKTKPDFKLLVNGNTLNAGDTFNDYLPLTFKAWDNLSGIASAKINIGGEDYSLDPKTGSIDINMKGKLGSFTALITAEDMAGNTILEIPFNFNVTTNISSMKQLVNYFTSLGELSGPIIPQLTNDLEQAQHQLDLGRPDNAAKHIQDFADRLNNKALSSCSSEKAKTILNADAHYLINKN